MFRIVGLMCLITMTGETTCTTHYRDDFKTWPTHELCMPHAEAALEETINTLKNFNFSCFWSRSRLLRGVERSGRPIGRLFSYFRRNPT